MAKKLLSVKFMCASEERLLVMTNFFGLTSGIQHVHQKQLNEGQNGGTANRSQLNDNKKEAVK